MPIFGLLAIFLIWQPLLPSILCYTTMATNDLPPPGMSSLTFVFDRTGSMNDDLTQVRQGAKGIFDMVMKQRKKLIYNYVLVLFHDPDVDPPYITTDPALFQHHLDTVSVQGGLDCPEMALSGIKKALEVSLPGSYVYVFTDARSKDYHLVDHVLNLIMEKQSQVVFVMTGDCGNRTAPGYQVFEKIAATSFGQVFHLEKAHVNSILEYVKQSVSQRKVHILYEVREHGQSHVREIPVDSHLSELALSFAGHPEDDEFMEMVVIDPEDKTLDRTTYANESGTIDLESVKIVRIKNPRPGKWKVRTSSRVKNTLRVFGHGEIDFKYGFASRPVNNIELAHPRPVGGQNTYLMVNMTGLSPPGTAVSISMVDYHGKELFRNDTRLSKHDPFLYFVGPFIPPKGFFFVRVNGADEHDYEFIRIAPTAISTVETSGPRAYMAERTSALAFHSVNLTCSIESRTPYQVYWKQGDTIIAGPLFYESTDTSFWTINEVMPYHKGYYSCEVVSLAGNHSATTFLDSREPLPHITAFRNESVVLHTTAYLHCRTQSVKQAKIEWIRNGAIIGNSAKSYLFENGTLRILDSTHADTGAYTCRATTGGGQTEATMHLSVHDLPTARVVPNNIYIAEGSSFSLSCIAGGVPTPEVSWYFKGNKIVPDTKYYISYRNDLSIRDATRNDVGIYECRTTNPAGIKADYAHVNLAIAPTVQVSKDRHLIGRGDHVVLDCRVTSGTPTPTITWFKEDRPIAETRYIQIQGGRLIIRGAQDTDAGRYSCKAENIAGADIKSINVDVGSMPTIIKGPDHVEVNIEKSVNLQCRAVGHPVPTVTWTRNGINVENLGERFVQLPDGSLLIKNVKLEDQGHYTCSAKNIFGQEDKTRMLVVTGLISPVLAHVTPELQLIEGQDLRINCIVLMGTPKPSLEWFKDGIPLRETPSAIVQGDGSLLLKGGNPSDEGRYTCKAVSPAGNASINTHVLHITKPVIVEEGLEKDLTVETGEPLDLPCPIQGTPKPKIVWSHNGLPLNLNSPEYAMLNDFTLRIYKVGSVHSGTYTCTAINLAGETQRSTNVNVYSAPQIEPAQTSYNLVQGDTVTLDCRIEQGEPKPTIKWYLNDEIFKNGIIEEDGSLVIDGVEEQHRGQFRCVAENDVGKDERVISLTVHTAPIIEGSGTTKTLITTVNETAVLPCPARAYPPPNRVWSYEGSRILAGPNFNTLVEIRNDGSLVLNKAQMNHAGHYECHVSNLAGDDSISYILKVQNPPKIVSDIPGTIDVVLGLVLDIPCRTVGTPEPVVTWEKNGFQIISGAHMRIDPAGTLHIPQVTLGDQGVYKCIATNPAGKDSRSTTVVVQEPPVIIDNKQPTEYTYINGESAELKCFVTATPAPKITWLRQGVPITENTSRHKMIADGTLKIENVSKDDNLFYTCEATNVAGKSETDIKLNVISPPEIEKPDEIQVESIKIGSQFSLYCPVFSTPLPEISWQLDEKPIVESDPDIVLSEDKRRLHIMEARVTDAGIYKCIARNPAGSISKTFQVEVTVPPTVDETTHKRKLTVREQERIEIGCPINGIPTPTISWLVKGSLLSPRQVSRGVKLGPSGDTLIIDAAQVEHDGTYVCVTSNKAGTLDVEVELQVLAPPKVGQDEDIEIVAGKPLTLNCDVQNIGEKSSITWLFNGTERLPKNAQVSPNIRRIFVLDSNKENHGLYQCLIRNSAGETRKKFNVNVLIPPEFAEKEFENSIQVISGTSRQLTCGIHGNPQPEIEWQKDGVPLNVRSSDDNNHLVISEERTIKSRYTCVATNKAGTVSRDFFVQFIAPPKLADEREETVTEVMEGHTITLDCPLDIDSPLEAVSIEWFMNGRPIKESNKFTVSFDRSRLVMTNALSEDETTFTCLAKNFAGEVSKNFKLKILVPPKLEGSIIEDVSVVEGAELDIQCLFFGEPMPDVTWSKNGMTLPNRANLLNENRSIYIEEASLVDAGSYRCNVSNVVGKAEKTFNVHVIAKPKIAVGKEQISEVEVMHNQPITLECPILEQQGIEIIWMKNEIPITPDQQGVQILANGRHLHVKNVFPNDVGNYACIAKNVAGETRKDFRMEILIPPSIKSVSGEFKIVENNSAVFPCDAEGSPLPKIQWKKDGLPADNLPHTQILNNGQQLRITSAKPEHIGEYTCIATNKVASADIHIDVDVISIPTISQAVHDTIQVVAGENAQFACPIKDRKFSGEIIWLKNFVPIHPSETKFIKSHSDRQLTLLKATPSDEDTYSCRVRNEAGETRVDYKLQVLVPPQIVMLDKDKNRTIIENKAITLTCPSTGKPEPTINWYKDGELLRPENVSKKISSAKIDGQELVIARVQVPNGGRYTCEAVNKAGTNEQDINLDVLTPPKIQRENISSEIDGTLSGRAMIICPATGKPQPKITWLKAGRPLDDAKDIYLSNNRQRLHFKKLNEHHADKYTCIAKNSAGEDKRDFALRLLEEPKIDGENLLKELQINSGRTSTLSCPASGSPYPTITWFKDGQPLTQSARYIYLNNGRQLQISDSRPEDTARYTCIASNVVGTADLDIFLKIIGAPEIAGLPVEPVSVIINKPHVLHCDIKGSEPLTIEWQKGGINIDLADTKGTLMQTSDRGRKLHILSAQRTDAARFTCVAKNPAGEVRKNFDLTVQIPPTILDSASSPPLQNAIPGDEFRIECRIDAIPQAKIKWFKNDEPLTQTDLLIIGNDDQTLWVRRADEKDEGRYSCLAENDVGSAKKNFIVKITGPPTFDKGLQTTDAAVGDHVILDCQVQGGTGDLNVNWVINGKPTQDGIFSSTVTVNGRKVIINGVRLSDAGEYICHAENEAGHAMKTFDLNVLERPRFIDTTTNNPFIVGRPLIIDCSATGTPRPTITWRKDGVLMPETSENYEFLNEHQQLHIEEAKESDAGRYSCVAENIPGRAEKDVVVELLKQPKMMESKKQVEVPENETQTLTCPIEDDSVTFEWFKNGLTLTTSSNLQLSSTRQKLHIMHAHPSDTSTYSCVAENAAGTDEAVFDVLVLVPPSIIGPAFKTIDGILNQEISLQCQTTGIPPPQIEWLFDGKQVYPTDLIQILDNGATLKINKVKSSQEGRYTCLAMNKVGKAESDTFIQVNEPPTIKEGPTELKVIEGQGQTIPCEVSGAPTPEVEWRKNNEPVSAILVHSSANNHYVHIREANTSDSGRYTCIATNRAGESRQNIQLHVLVLPTILEGERLLKVTEGAELVLDCYAKGIPPPKVTWRKDGSPMNIEENRLTLSNVSANDAGRFTCEARNEAGADIVDFAVDVLIKPKMKAYGKDVRVVEGERARLECKAEGNPIPTIRWMRGGRPITDMENYILSPRGENLLILKTKRTDAGDYSCIVKNTAGEIEAPFTVTVLTSPHIDEPIDQNPRVIQNKEVVLRCPALGNPMPTVTWKKEGEPIANPRFIIEDGFTDLIIKEAKTTDAGRYTCHAENEVNVLDTDYQLEIIAPPKFGGEGQKIYEVLQYEPATLTCPVEASPAPEFYWTRGGEPIYPTNNIEISPDNQKITVKNTSLLDGGKYTCKATNVAGSTEIDLSLRVLIPPKIDESNMIHNPLAILGRTIYIECPVTGIPQPSVIWTRDGIPIKIYAEKYAVDQGNQTFGIKNVQLSDQGKYACVVENKGGKAQEEFNIEVLSPPQMETAETQKLTKREGEPITLICPIRTLISDPGAGLHIGWVKDGRPLDTTEIANYQISSEGRRLHMATTTIKDAGKYDCVATNRAGQTSQSFAVEILSKPTIDKSRNDPNPHVIQGRPFTLWCPASGHPFPTVKWFKNGVLVDMAKHGDQWRLLDKGQGLEIIAAKPSDKGVWTCIAENDAGTSEEEINLDIWVGPQVIVRPQDEAIKQLGSTVTLLCSATGNPPPVLSWSKAGQVIISSPEGARISLTGTRLDLPKLQMDDAGEYMCIAKNDVGTASDSITVDILVPPVISRDGVELNPRLPTGRTLTLFCDAAGKPPPLIKWFVNNTGLESSENVLIADNGQFIQITNVSLNDKGFYKCEVNNVAGTDEILFKVDVDQAPQIHNGGTEQVVEGRVAVMECQTTGEPAPLVTWQRNGIRVETGLRYIVEDNMLKVIDARSSDSGIYVCVATNEAGIDQQAFTLEVLVSPKITSTSPNESIVPVGSPFSLRCGARGYPFPEITWTVNDEPIETALTQEYSVAEDGTLYVKEALQKGMLTFKCTVHNDAGLDEKEYIVRAISPPSLTKEGLKTLNSTEGEPALLYCEIETGDQEIIWQKNGNALGSDTNFEVSRDGLQLQILSTGLHDEGLYSCTAMNSAGNATQKIQLWVGVPPKISEKSRRVVVKKGELAELWCEAVGIPPPQISWLKDNQPLIHTAVDDTTDKLKTTAVFQDVTPDQAGVYTCKAMNWAGTVYKDVDLVVLTPPEIYPERQNFTANPRETIILPCNASGIPEPVVSWVKVPDTDIIGKESKYQILGTSLAIKNISAEDDGFYHCIAKSDAGQSIGVRRVSVMLPLKDYKRIWVECDDAGNPIKSTYVPARGDTPESEENYVHWDDESQENVPTMNGTDGVFYFCLPGQRDRRKVPLAKVPHFIESPKSQKVLLGGELKLTCSAVGPPTPLIYWMKNGVALDEFRANSTSALKILVNSPSDIGNFTCIAKNTVGENRATSEIGILGETPFSQQKDSPAEFALTVLNCIRNKEPQNRKIVWKIDGESINLLDDSSHALNNGSLVLSYFAMEKELESLQCFIDKEPADGFSVAYLQVSDEVPKVNIPPSRIVAHHSTDIVADCKLKHGNPLTTRVRWSKDNVNLHIDHDKYELLPNNSLLIRHAMQSDRGAYKCRAWNSKGKSWDGTDLVIADNPAVIITNISGTVNGKPITHQNLMANITPEVASNDITLRIDNLAGEHASITKTIVNMLSIPITHIGYDPKAKNLNASQKKKVERVTDYRFGSGQHLVVTQTIHGFDGDQIEMDVDFDGEVPDGDQDSISFDPLEEYVVEEEKGKLKGHGHTIMKLGKLNLVPIEWDDSINYENESEEDDDYDLSSDNNFKVENGTTMHIHSRSHISKDAIHIETKVDRFGHCPEGYAKIQDRCRDINECMLYQEICGQQAKCINTNGGYRCDARCPSGYHSKLDGNCVDLDECLLGIANCSIGTECSNAEGSYTCFEACVEGYFLNAQNECQDIDECQTHPCNAPMICENLFGSYACICPHGFPAINGTCKGLSLNEEHPLKIIGYETNPDEKLCPQGFKWRGSTCEDVDECSFDAPCQYSCKNSAGSFQCTCPEGYIVNELGQCIDVDECQLAYACNSGELCFNQLGSYSCISNPCPSTYHIDETNQQCLPNCQNCSKPPINLHMLSIPRGVEPETPLLRLTAQDKDGRILKNTRFLLKALDFQLKTENGRATILNKNRLLAESKHQLFIRSLSISQNQLTKYRTDFIVYIAVSKHPF